MLKNALTRLFNYELSQASPVQDDFVRIEKCDEDGNVFTVYEKFDYPKHQASLGSVNDWSLNALLKAGISPNFNIHTGFNTRLDGVSQVASISDAADKILAETNENVD